MKVLVALAVCIVAASAYVRRPIEQPKSKIELVQLDEVALATQFEEFTDVIPMDKLIALVTSYVQQDKEVLHHWNYMLSPEFRDTVAELEKAPEFFVLLDYIDVSGIDIYTYVNIVNGVLGLDPIVKEKDSDKDSKEKDSEEKDGDKKDSEEKDDDKKDSEEKKDDKKDSEEKEVPESYKIGKGMAGLVADFKAAMPYKKIYAMHDRKMVNECPYALFMNRMFTPDFGTVIQNLFHSEAYRNMVQVAVHHDIDVVRVRDLAHAMMAIDRDQN